MARSCVPFLHGEFSMDGDCGKGRPDVVIGTSPPIFQALSRHRLVARVRRAPFLLEIRDLWPAFAIDMGVLRKPDAY